MSRSITAVVADDEPPLARALVAMLGQVWPELQVPHVARNGLEAAELIAVHHPDLAFLDIRMPGLSGLEVAEGIEGHTRVVFVTAYDDYAVQAFEQAALDYLLKPVTTERLQRTAQRLRQALDTPGAPASDDERLLRALRRLAPAATAGSGRLRWVRASVGELMHQVAVDEVLFFQADDKYTCVRTTGGADLLIRTPITELAQRLDPQQFVQVHRATIVNLSHLVAARRDEASRLFLRLRGHAGELPVSRAYVHLFKAM